MSDHGRLIPLSTTLNVFVFRVYRTYYICIRLFPNAFIKTNPLRLIPINFDSNLDSNCLLFDNIGIRRIREGKRRKEKRTYKKKWRRREARYDIFQNENIYAVQRLYPNFLSTRINGRGIVCLRGGLEGPGPFPTLGRRKNRGEERRRLRHDVYIYIYLYGLIGRERDRAVKFSVVQGFAWPSTTIPEDLLVSD